MLEVWSVYIGAAEGSFQDVSDMPCVLLRSTHTHTHTQRGFRILFKAVPLSHRLYVESAVE